MFSHRNRTRALPVRRWLCLWAAMILLASPAWADPSATALTLKAATQQALEQTPLLQARQAKEDAAREEAGRAGALPDPQLTFGIDNLAIQGPGAFTAGGDTMTMRTVGYTQVLPSRTKRQAQRDVAGANVEQAESTTAMTRLGIEQQVATAWISAWGAHHEVQMLQGLRQEWAVDVVIAEARLRGGSGSAADVLAMRMEALDLENRIDEAASRETQARASLERWLGASVNQPLADAPDFSVLPHDKSSLLASVDEQGNLLDWPAREHAAEAALEEAKAEKHPEWSVGLSYGSRVNGLSDMVTVQVGVSLPLFTRNRQDRGISARADDLDAIRSEHDDARRQQTEAVRAAWAQWDALGRQVRRHLDQLLPQANDRAALALASYRGGGDIQPLLDARRDEISHHTDFARMLTDYGRAWAALAYLLPERNTP
ncbi:TolC family protein [Dyella silvae]|uniref:TolC family protein n=1 Tax=Dyella silvae TaxID=2994424 RepID=UPI0022656D4A|nr:TolC family protein [Dyella silvae]